MVKVSLLLCFLGLVAFGFLHGSLAAEKIGTFELKKGNFSVKFTDWGATIISVVLPDKKNGKLADVVLGYDSVNDYKTDATYFGAIVGGVANRIGGAQYALDGKHYKLVANEGRNMLHGGPKGFSDVVWTVRKYMNKGPAPHIVFAYKSFDGEGFPGYLFVTVAYTLIGNNQLSVRMKAEALNKATPVNLAQHTYWNLGGHNSGDILSEDIQIFASNYTPVDSQLLPTGKIVSGKGTPYDFLKSHPISSTINKLANGYDINCVLDGKQTEASSNRARQEDRKNDGAAYKCTWFEWNCRGNSKSTPIKLLNYKPVLTTNNMRHKTRNVYAIL